MAKNVIIEVRHSPGLATAALTGDTEGVGASIGRALPSLRIDPSFPPVAIPSVNAPSLKAAATSGAEAAQWSEQPKETTFLLRGVVDDDKEAHQMGERAAGDTVVGVFADPVIEPNLICPGSPPLGTDKDVERLLCCDRLRHRKMDGSGVMLAIVDTGINQAHLVAHGKHPHIDTALSWAPPSKPGTGGNWPVNHGTMCAFDALIAAPNATILDIAVLQSRRPGHTVMEGLLSDAVLAYSHLVRIMRAHKRPGQARSMVVSNSWGMFHPSWDFPVGNPGNYSDNPNHPFNRIVATLDRAGADILFAAGNCGKDCPDGRCQGVTTKAIYGANSSPFVLTVAGVDVTGLRVGYSAEGPGRLAKQKPDVCGYTHFKGSGVYPADGGTSAATPVVAGVVAAVRSKRPYAPSVAARTPEAIRKLVETTALHKGTPVPNFDYGYGIINGCRLSAVVTTDEEATFEDLLREMEATAVATGHERTNGQTAAPADDEFILVTVPAEEASPVGTGAVTTRG